MDDAGAPTGRVPPPRPPRRPALRYVETRDTYPLVVKADGLAAGKGVIICQRLRRGPGGGRELPRRARASAPPATWSSSRSSSPGPRCRCWRSATARPWCRWLRPRTTSASSPATRVPTPAAWAATARCPGFDADGPRRAPMETSSSPCSPRCAAARHRLPRRALRRPDRHRGRRQGARVQLPLRRPRDAGRSCRASTATCSSSAWRRRSGELAGVAADLEATARASRSSWPRPATRRAAPRATSSAA